MPAHESAFGSLVVENSSLNRDPGRFIAIAYEAKDIADYQTEYDVDRESAVRVVDGAKQSLAQIKNFLKIA